MEIVITNSFGTNFINFLKQLFNSFLNIWDVLNYSFGTIDFTWVYDYVSIPESSPFYLETIDLSLISLVTNGFTLIILIKLVNLILKK